MDEVDVLVNNQRVRDLVEKELLKRGFEITHWHNTRLCYIERVAQS